MWVVKIGGSLAPDELLASWHIDDSAAMAGNY